MAHADINSIEGPLRFCSEHVNTLTLSEDRNVLCFDGPITSTTNLDDFNRLNDRGVVVARSAGGNIIRSMQIANILLDKDATVIIRDYCLSACANAIFVAANVTHVATGAIVAWHRGVPKILCGASVGTLPFDNDTEAKQQEDHYSEYCRHSDLINNFYKKRNIADDFTQAPQTLHTQKLFKLLMQEAPDKNRVFWMWNPRNFGAYFQDKIVFQSFPESQEAVDQAVRRLRLPIRVIYDPPRDPR
jgi:hypothetical protein